jgi:hypothetical protein
MKQQSKLSSEQQQEHVVQSQSEMQAGLEFATAEELLRFDAAQTAVPDSVVERLGKSAADLPPPKKGWWKRLFGGARS